MRSALVSFLILLLFITLYKGCTVDTPVGTIYRPIGMGNISNRDCIIVGQTKYTYQWHDTYWMTVRGGFKNVLMLVGYRRVK